jgi:hypothetical protein
LFYTANDWRSESTKLGVEAIEAGVVLQMARWFFLGQQQFHWDSRRVD